jgi:hypothetical protein
VKRTLVSVLALLLFGLFSGCARANRVALVVVEARQAATPTSIILAPVEARLSNLPTDTALPVTVTPTLTPIPTRTSAPTPTDLPTPVLPSGPVIARSYRVEVGGLVLEAFPVAPARADISDCAVFSPIAAALHEARWRHLPQQEMLTVEAVNRVIQPFGYYLDGDPPGPLYKGGDVLREVLYLPVDGEGLVVNRSGTDFAWFINDTVVEGWLVQREHITKAWNLNDHAFLLPKFRGDDLVMLQRTAAPENRVEVLINDEVVYQTEISAAGSCPVKGLRTWQDQWVLNLENDVIIEGKPLSESSGFPQVFDWMESGGKPLFFFQDEARAGIVYAGEIVPVTFDTIWHQCIPAYQAACPQPAAATRAGVTWFFALRDGQWQYIEVTPANMP